MKIFLIMCLLWLSAYQVIGQDLLEDLEKEQPETTSLTSATFKGTRLINGHSVETREKGIMEFIISHRFGEISSGSYNLYGLDESNVRFALEYAFTNKLYIGLGRSSFEKTYDIFIKYRLLRQDGVSGSIPVSLTWFSSLAIKTLKSGDEKMSFGDKLASTHQLLIARKFSPALSLQLMPTYIHINTIKENEINNTLISLGVGGRIKITPRMSLNTEYYYQFNTLSNETYNAFAVGVDIETGGHVFQIQLTNSRAMIEKGFITETTSDFFSGDIRLGFNISRAFQLSKDK